MREIQRQLLDTTLASIARIDHSGHKPTSGVLIHHDSPRLCMTWPMAEGEHGVNGPEGPAFDGSWRPGDFEEVR